MKYLFLLFILVYFGAAQSQSKLPPKIEADKQIYAASQAMKDSDWRAAVSAFEAAEATGYNKLPEIFDYVFGKALNNIGDFDRANRRLEDYLKNYGEKGKFYAKAIEEIAISQVGIQKREADAKRIAAEQKIQNDERLAQQKKDREIERSWETYEFRYWVMDRYGNADCADTRKKIRSRVKSSAMRKFSCSCDTVSIDHPAWRGHSADICSGTIQVNQIIDPDADLSDGESSNNWTLSFK